MMGRGSARRSEGNGRRSLEASDGLMVRETCAVCVDCVDWKGRETHCTATGALDPAPYMTTLDWWCFKEHFGRTFRSFLP